MSHISAEPVTFVVTDIETDGHSPLRNSMLSFASVAVDYEGTEYGTFEANLVPRADRTTDPRTMEWWQTQPEAWAAATSDPEPPETVMPSYADWIEALPGFKVFTAAPLMFDGLWMDHYLDTYAQTRALGGPYTGRQLFAAAGYAFTPWRARFGARTISIGACSARLPPGMATFPIATRRSTTRAALPMCWSSCSE